MIYEFWGLILLILSTLFLWDILKVYAQDKKVIYKLPFILTIISIISGILLLILGVISK